MTLSLVQTIPGGIYRTPGPQYVVPANAANNLLVLFAAWDVSAEATSGQPVVPVGAVADDQNNWWRPVGDTGNLVPGSRAGIWVCPNALPVNRWLSFCPQGNVSAFAFLMAEFSGLPASYWPLLDFAVPLASKSATSLNVSGTATTADYAFTMMASGTTGASPSQGSGGWTSLGTSSAGGASPNGILLSAQYGSFAAGSVPSTWSSGVGAFSAAALTVGITQASNLPVQINPGFPRVFVEAAFGSSPGNPEVPILDTAWTDISSYCIGPAGQTSISVSQGRAYELAQPEAGTCTIALNNQAGTFNPVNTGSPFYPNVLPGVPVRVSAQYSGRRYPIWSGYVERWPQDFPDWPQWGWSTMVATDGVGVAASVSLPSAVQGEILADNPYCCFPFNEQYSSSQNTINGVTKTSTEAQGLPAVNVAPGNQRVATYIDGNQHVATGQSVGFLGDSGTGMGASGYSGIDTSNNRGPGAQYGPDLGMPLITSSGGDAAFEMWFNVPSVPNDPLADRLIQLYQVFVQPYLGINGANDLGGGLFLSGGVFVPATAGPPAFYTQVSWLASPAVFSSLAFGTLHHLILNISNDGVTYFIDGVNFGTDSGFPEPLQLAGCTFGLATYAYGQDVNALVNYTVAYGTIYPYHLATGRVTDHYHSGALGFTGDTMIQRAARYLAWSRLNLGLAGPAVLDHLKLAAAYSTSGSPLASALSADAISSDGLWFVGPAGNLTVLPRPYLYNQPSSVTFGDNPALSEVPYEADASFDFDNTYLQNSAQATLQQGPNSLAIPVIRAPSSINQYFERGPLQQQISATFIQDASDRANWSLNKYQQPSLRVRQLKVNLASRPANISAILQTTIADVATINRRPLGQSSNAYSLPVVVGKVQHEIGPGKWEVTYQMYPNVPEGTILETDASGSDVLGSNALAW